MKTVQQIVDRLRERQPGDMFGFEVSEYLRALPFGAAKEFLKEDATPEVWAADNLPDLATDEALTARVRGYMPFAWDKANNCRGLSAGRSLAHYAAWLWMLGDDDLAAKMGEYTCYGKPQLRAICEKYGIDWEKLDDGAWSSTESGPAQRACDIAKI